MNQDAPATAGENSRPVALITGAGSGIGRAVSHMLADAGWRVALTGRRENVLRETASARPDAEWLVLPTDLSEMANGGMLVERVLDAWGRLDALVNNAGAVEVVPLAETDSTLVLRMFRVNAFGPAALIAHAGPVMAEQGGGCIVNVSSMATVDPFPGLAIYAAAKSALESLTRSVRVELGPAGVRAFSVAPGAVETAMLRSIVSEDDFPASLTHHPDHVAEVIVSCIFGRRDDEIGKTILLPND